MSAARLTITKLEKKMDIDFDELKRINETYDSLILIESEDGLVTWPDLVAFPFDYDTTMDWIMEKTLKKDINSIVYVGRIKNVATYDPYGTFSEKYEGSIYEVCIQQLEEAE